MLHYMQHTVQAATEFGAAARGAAAGNWRRSAPHRRARVTARDAVAETTTAIASRGDEDEKDDEKDNEKDDEKDDEGGELIADGLSTEELKLLAGGKNLLRWRLEERGLSTKGSKATLRKRLAVHMRSTQGRSEPTRSEATRAEAGPSEGSVDVSKLRRDMGYAAVTAELSAIQPQINQEQMQAVRDILRHEHGNVPYLVFGPPGTGKTMVLIEAALQALTHERRPRLLICAPSNAAADVVAKRLHALMPEAERRRREVGSTYSNHGMRGDPATSPDDGDGDEKVETGDADGDEDATFSPAPLSMLRLYSQHHAQGAVPVELLSYCYTDKETDMFSVPPLESLLSYSVIVCTCGATRLLMEAGVPPVHTAVLTRPNPSNPAVTQSSVSISRLQMGGRLFTHVLIDEASQGLEPELMLPLICLSRLLHRSPRRPQAAWPVVRRRLRASKGWRRACSSA